MSEKTVVVALGHRALGTTLPEQKTAARLAAKAIADLVEEGTRVVISHSNGPQVGMIHTAMNEFGKAHPDYTFAPMSVCSAMSQGYIGYDLQNAIRAELISRGIYKPVSTILTQVVIDPYDEAFSEPEKIIGRVLNAEEAEAEEEKGNFVTKVGEGQYRRILAAPKPQKIVEIETVKVLSQAEQIVIAAGGGAIIRYFEEEGAELRLAAPTGRAAKRMTEATGYEAQTIHRLLELNGMPEGEQEGRAVHFDRNFENPLEADVIIIDEMSMVDIALMHSLLLAITAGTRLILVGDENQLPSVGPGNVLRDIIRSGCFSVVELKKIFRQASESDIVVNAHKINRGEQVTINNKSRDFFFLKRYDADIIIRVVIALIQEKLPRYVDAKPYEIQVLTPMRKGLLGVERLNQILQRYLNPPDEKKKEKEIGQRLFREGDKVMQVKNNYQLEWEILGRYKIPVDKGVGVFNGDTGIMTEINEFAETATVEFEDGRQAQYSFKQLEELELAYAVTIHKSQGSEYPAVILPILSGPRMLMNRNLLYTAVTRARKCVTVVGSENTFAEMIRNEKQQQRYSSLDRRIRELDEAEIN